MRHAHTPSRPLRSTSFRFSFQTPFTFLSTPWAGRGAVLSPFERLSPPFEAIHFLNPFGRRGLLSFPTMRRPGHAVRVCASRASRPLRPFAFLFERLSPVIFSTPLAGAAFSDFRRISRTRREGLTHGPCPLRTHHHASGWSSLHAARIRLGWSPLGRQTSDQTRPCSRESGRISERDSCFCHCG